MTTAPSRPRARKYTDVMHPYPLQCLSTLCTPVASCIRLAACGARAPHPPACSPRTDAARSPP
eukprot:982856-Prymnesium_polylepis.2